MRKQTEILEIDLSNEGIDRCSQRVNEFLTDIKADKRDIIRYCMASEEILLKSREILCEDTQVKVRTGTRFMRPFFSLEISGASFNSYAKERTEQGIFNESILKNIGISPEYSYANDANVYTFRIKRKQLNPFIKFSVAIASAILVGLIGQILPNGMQSVLLDDVIVPLYDTFFNILGCIAGPMIFLSVAWGIYGIGDAATLKRVGKNILTSYIGTVFLSSSFISLLVLPFYRLNFYGASQGANEASSVFTMILGIVPKNIFSPFVEGNTLQIIFLAIVIGIAMLFLGQKTNEVAKIVEQINYIVSFQIDFISRLVPCFIFIVVVKILWSDTVSVLLSIWKTFLLFLAAIMIISWCYIIYTSMRNRIQPITVIRKALPSLIVGITTASSAATFGNNLNICKKEYGIDENITAFGLPLGMVTLKPATSINYLIVSMFFAEYYHIHVSAAWVVLLIFTCSILAIATPPIPGGAMTAYTVLFSQLGIPKEALAIALACDVLFDFVDTGTDQFILPMSLLNQATRMGMVDRQILTGQPQKKAGRKTK